jgi:cobalt-zinc-cadmium efflux system protein
VFTTTPVSAGSKLRAMAHAEAPGPGNEPGAPPGGQVALAARREGNRRRMWVAAAINAGLIATGVVGGVLTGSLALLADAGHALSDLGAIGLGLLAARLAGRPGGPRRTFGLQRSEVMAALLNGLALVAIAVLILIAALDRLGDPPEVEGAGVVVLGLLGLAGNTAATWVLASGRRDDINLEAVLRHSAADALGSLGVVVSGVVILATGWEPIDPLIGIAIAALILASSVRLVRDPFDVLMESAPRGVDAQAVAREIGTVDGVREVHDLHVWSVTSGFEALAAHVVVAPGRDRDLARREVEFLLRERYGIEHTTLQMEERAEHDALLQVSTRRHDG